MTTSPVVASAILFTGAISAHATGSAVDEVTVTVPVSCSLTSTVGSAHTAIVEPGTLEENIGETTFKVLCNDSSGFSVYAIGYSDDTYGNTTMKPSTLSASNGIATGTANRGFESYWAMKLSAVSGDYAPTLENGFDDYHAVPDEYTKVVSLNANTDATTGSSFKSTYAAFISQTQPADTYTGKVKYTIVHPASANAPVNAIEISNLTYLQEFKDLSDAERQSILASMVEDQQYQLKDARDEKSYYVAKLKDGNVWMTQNLDHDIDSTRIYTPDDTDIPANWTPSTSTYATGVTTWNSSASAPESYDPGDLYWNGTLDTTGVWDNYWQHGGDSPLSSFISSTGDSHYHLGNYYNWNAAVAMNDTSSLASTGTLVDQSICPAGWTLPRSGFGPDSFYALVNEYDTWDSSASTLNNGFQLWGSPTFLSLSGTWGGSLGIAQVGYAGGSWSPVTEGSDEVYIMELYSKSGLANPGIYTTNRYEMGISVRCVARPVASAVSFTEP